MKYRLFQLVYTIANAGLITYGLLALISPKILLEPFFAHVYTFPAGADEAVVYLGALFRLLGYFNILVGAVGLLLLWRWRNGRQRWALWTLTAVTSLAYLGPVTFDNTVGTIGFFEIVEHVLFLLVILFAIVMFADSSQQVQPRQEQETV